MDLESTLIQTQADLMAARRERDLQKVTADACGRALEIAEGLIGELRAELAEALYEADNLQAAVAVFAMEQRW